MTNAFVARRGERHGYQAQKLKPVIDSTKNGWDRMSLNLAAPIQLYYSTLKPRLLRELNHTDSKTERALSPPKMTIFYARGPTW